MARAVAIANHVAELVRKNGELTLGEICMNFGVAVSTAYNYMRLVKELFSDIEYKDGKLIHIQQEGEQ